MIHELSEPLSEASRHQPEDPTKFFHHQPDPFIGENPYDTFVSAFNAAQKQNETLRIGQLSKNSTVPPSFVKTTQKQFDTTPYGLIDHESAKPNVTVALNDEEGSTFQDGPECSAIDCYKKWDPVCDSE